MVDIILAAVFTALGILVVTQYVHIQDLEEYRDTNHACQLDVDVAVGRQIYLYELAQKGKE